MTEVDKNIDLEIIKNYSKELLNEINSDDFYDDDSFLRNIFKFVILRYDYDKYEFKISEFFRELRNLKKNDAELRNKKELYDLIDKYLGVSEVEKKINGEVYTPFWLIDQILDVFPTSTWSNPYEKIFDGGSGIGNFEVVMLVRFMDGLKSYNDKIDLRNEEVRYKWIMENIIYTCDISDKNTFLYKNIFDPNNKLELNHYCGDIFSKDFNDYMKKEWNIPHFTKCVGNPPYNHNIDLKFLLKYYDMSDSVAIVHPATWILDEKNIYKPYVNIREKLKIDLEKIILFNGNKTFNIEIAVPCVITYVNKFKNIKNVILCDDKYNKKNITYKNINDINKFSDLKIYPNIKNKILEKSKQDNLLLHKNHNDGDFYVNLAAIVGHTDLRYPDKMFKDDFFTFIPKNLKISLNPEKKIFFSFQTENESTNFLNFLKTLFSRFCLSIYKSNKNLDSGELAIVPWLDFTQKWDDRKLYEYFNLTTEEINFIEKYIPNYYGV
jgi:hypothetical protein